MKNRIVIILLFLFSSVSAFSQFRGVFGFDFFGNGTSSALKKSSVAPYTFTANMKLMPGIVLVNKVSICGVVGYQRYGRKDEPLDKKTIGNTIESGIGIEYVNYKPKHKLTPLVGIKYLWFNEKIKDFSTLDLDDKTGFGTIANYYAGCAYKCSTKLYLNTQCEITDKTYKSEYKGFEQYDIKVHWSFGFRYLLK